jgi:hypothetical protein
MEAVDGNAIAGQLYEFFGAEMTAARGTCAHCGTESQIAELRVYNRAPGAVARCRTCGQVVLVVVDIRGSIRVNSDAFSLPSP